MGDLVPGNLREVGLHYVPDAGPGIRRRRAGAGWSYRLPEGAPVDRPTRERIARLAIPPAWTDVWICPDAAGHLQASGRDARGRKQYRYHERWTELRNTAKYDDLVRFAAALPTLRRTVADDLRTSGTPHEKVIALVVALLDRTLIRVGNDEYRRSNGSFGLTTLYRRHVSFDGGT